MIADHTPLIPEIIAMNVTTDPAIQQALVNKAERHFATNDQFSRRLRGAKCREYLHAFMSHWLEAHLKTNKPIL